MYVFFVVIMTGCVSGIEENLNIDLNLDKISSESSDTDELKKFSVTYEDLENYIKFKKLEAKSRGYVLNILDINEIYSTNGYLAMYVISFQDGWEAISADKRSPLVLATSEKGSFNFTEGMPQMCYLDQIADDLAFFIDCQNLIVKETKSVPEDICANIELWDAISASNDFVELYKIDPSTPLDSTLIDPPGHWELTSVTSTQVLDQQVDHLIPVSWGQSSPYNMFCPNRTDNNAIKTPAGCVALSGAQTLAYLQDLMDLNISVPSTVVSSGNVDAFEIQFSDFGTTLWNNIYTNDTSAASLIAYIGYLVNIEYGNLGSSAKTKDLRSLVFQPLGINCHYGDYDGEIVKSSLLDSLPVIVSAYYKLINGGHSFIIDGYKSYKTKYTYTYDWVYDIPPSASQDLVCPKIEVTYSSPYIENIRINWGWANIYGNNDIWYTPTEDWAANLGSSWESFKYNKNMIYGFSKL